MDDHEVGHGPVVGGGELLRVGAGVRGPVLAQDLGDFEGLPDRGVGHGVLAATEDLAKGGAGTPSPSSQSLYPPVIARPALRSS